MIPMECVFSCNLIIALVKLQLKTKKKVRRRNELEEESIFLKISQAVDSLKITICKENFARRKKY